MSAFELIRYVEQYDVARLTLARAPLNVMTIGMMQEITAALERAAASPALKALVVAGEGKAFSAGVAVEDAIFRRLRELECATLAVVHGAALGGGAELATFCDMVIASEAATFGQPEVKVGVFPPIAALHYPRRIGTAQTLRLLLSGAVIGAAEAARIGLADVVVPAERLAETVDAEIERLRAQSAVVLRLTKRAVRDALGAPFDEALATLETIYHYELMTTEDAAEGLRAFMEKRKPVWKDR